MRDSVVVTMTNFQLHKGQSTIIGASLVDYDGAPESSVVVQVTQSGFPFIVTPVSGPPVGQRLFKVTVPASSIASSSGSIFLTANIPATGSGAGGSTFHDFVGHTIDAVVPVDHRSITAIPPTPEQPE